MSDVAAVSDLLVMTALQRAAARVVPRSARAALAADPTLRHRVHEQYAVPQCDIDRALAGAWELCPTLQARHQLPVDADEWAQVLDGYTRPLLLMSQPHSPSRLGEALAQLVVVPIRASRAR